MPIPAGTRLGNYEILSLLGAGGMGQVYRAVDLKLDRQVAIKVLADALDGAAEKERFLNEARAASSLDHPNIGTIHNIEETSEGLLYIVMTCYEGETLQGRLGRGPVSISLAVDTVIQIARGLAAAHAKGIVHRDIKPPNIMVTSQGVKILDFGLAKFNISGHLTQTGKAVGTPAYMSPEQALRRTVDHRTDIWSLGVVLYQLITGRLPFQADNVPAMLLAIAKESPPLIETMPSEIGAIVNRCLAKEPAGRYSNCRELLADLSRIQTLGEASTHSLFAADSGEPLTVAPAKESTTSAGWNVQKFVLIAVAFVFAAVLLWLYLPRFFSEPGVARQKHVLVLPFNNLGADASTAAICDGLLETLTSRLSSLQQPGQSLFVVPAAEVRRRKLIDPAEAKELLSTDLVVTGSVQRDRIGVRLTVTLIDTSTSPFRQVGSTVIDDQLGNFSTIQDKAVASLASLMQVELNPSALGRTTGEAAAAPAAYESYLKGLSYLQRYDKQDNIDTAIRLFEAATKDDPRFALAYARLGEAFWTKNRVNPSPGLVEKALSNAKRAGEINGDLAPVHVTLGRIHAGTGKYDLAVQEFQRAIELDAHSAEAYQQIARAYEYLGRIQEAEVALKKAIALRPEFWDWYNSLGGFYFRQRQYAQSAAAFRRVLELTPDNSAAYSNLGLTLNRMGNEAEARLMFEKSIQLNPSYAAYNNLAGLYYLAGEWSRAADAYEKSLRIHDRDHRPWAGLASALDAGGDGRKAREAYTRALQIGREASLGNPNNAEIKSAVALYCARLGLRAEAQSNMSSALTLAPNDSNILFQAALVNLALDNRNRALEYLSSALSHGYAKDRVRREPDLRKLQNDSAFRALMQ